MAQPWKTWLGLIASVQLGACDVCYRCYGQNKSCTSTFSKGICGTDYTYKSVEECQKAAGSGHASCAPASWNLCLHSCKDAEAKIWVDQVCHEVQEGPPQKCPPDARVDCQFWEQIAPTAFVDVKDGKTPEEQCKEYACDSGKKPFNALDHSACKGGPVPKPSPSSGHKILAPKKFGHQCLVLRESKDGFWGKTKFVTPVVTGAPFRHVSVGSCEEAMAISTTTEGVACEGHQANCTRDCFTMGACGSACQFAFQPMIMFPSFCQLFVDHPRTGYGYGSFELPKGRGPIKDLGTTPSGGPDYCLELQPCDSNNMVVLIPPGTAGTPKGEGDAWMGSCNVSAGYVLNTVVCTGSEDQIFEVLDSNLYV